MLDIDKLDKELHQKHLIQLQNDEYVQSVWTSPSGDGLKGIVFLNYTYLYDDVIAAHNNAYKQLSAYFWDRYNIILDINCNDVTRLCFLSNDPKLHIKDSFSQYRIFKEEMISESLKSSLKNPNIKSSKYNQRSMQRIYKYLAKRSLSITSSYHRWVFVALASTQI